MTFTACPCALCGGIGEPPEDNVLRDEPEIVCRRCGDPLDDCLCR